MAFEVFTAYGAASRPEATLRTSGYLFVSKGIMKRAQSENATHAQLMYDEIENRLGIRLYDTFDVPENESVREVSPEKSGIAVNLMPLLRFYGFPGPKILGKRVLPITLDGNVIVIDLKTLRQTPAVKQTPVVREIPAERVKSAPPKSPQSEEFDDDIPF